MARIPYIEMDAEELLIAVRNNAGCGIQLMKMSPALIANLEKQLGKTKSKPKAVMAKKPKEET